MEDPSLWLESGKTAGMELLSNLIDALPGLLGAIVLLIAGWLIARFLRAMSARLSNGLNRFFETVMPTGRLASFRISPRSAQFIGNVVYWLTILFAITLAADVASFETFSSWLAVIFGYLPRVLGGVLIVIVGYLLGAAIRDLVSTALVSMAVGQGEMIGIFAQWATFLTAVIIGIEQIGIDVTFLIVIISIVMGAVMGGMAIAFGLGARPLTSNLIGAHYLQQQYSPGQVLIIGSDEGQILEFTPTGVILETSAGRLSVPGEAYFHNQITLKEGDLVDA
ncbi:hypothetical protein J0X12_00995 [Sneathiella sp. CAU 1612]|uniref:Small-conductance mechanosensitive channel n=1 Tax=Sneathiella sedimenti TaxID=2816034 RepID=A0ABS3F146_9PROT|nr:hypothetical protein [Sneathiella sedimenti]MBO0332170.1 hypothetical protein [Sneathiella sedimenti]